MKKVRFFFQYSTQALGSTSEDFTSKCMSCHLKRRAFGAKQGEI